MKNYNREYWDRVLEIVFGPSPESEIPISEGDLRANDEVLVEPPPIKRMTERAEKE